MTRPAKILVDKSELGLNTAKNDKAAGMIIDAVFLTVEFFESRDRMNASVHIKEIQWSPITLLARECRMTIANLPEIPAGQP